MTPREAAQLEARIAIYGNATARTPADWTWLEFLQAAAKERAAAAKGKKKNHVEEPEENEER